MRLLCVYGPQQRNNKTNIIQSKMGWFDSTRSARRLRLGLMYVYVEMSKEQDECRGQDVGVVDILCR